MSVKTILKVEQVSHARILILALKGHGFNPIEGNDVGLAGMGGIAGPTGVAIQVPEEEAEDAFVLAQDLLKDILGQ